MLVGVNYQTGTRPRQDKGCLVQKAIRADVDWFMLFWNQQRLEHKARLPPLRESQKKPRERIFRKSKG